ncbi:hypothetical protein LIER_26780 [Lithospermum erythrorhizon]|uniref:Uncharacterized protein n=1 Tax=Lithospermum erythrorhizon TaxID=34254 RepID=A0AAV3RD95_LITER
MSINKGTQAKKRFKKSKNKGSKGIKGNMLEEEDVLEEVVPLRRVSPEPKKDYGPLLINAYRLPWYTDLEAFKMRCNIHVWKNSVKLNNEAEERIEEALHTRCMSKIDQNDIETTVDKAKVEKSDKEKDIDICEISTPSVRENVSEKLKEKTEELLNCCQEEIGTGKDMVEEEEVVAPSTKERYFNIIMSPDLGGEGLADFENMEATLSKVAKKLQKAKLKKEEMRRKIEASTSKRKGEDKAKTTEESSES